MLFDVSKTHFNKIFCHTILSNLIILRIDFSLFKIHPLNSFFSVLSFYTKDSIPLYLLLNPLDFIALSLLAINSTSTNLWSSLSHSLCLSHSVSLPLSLPLSLSLSLSLSPSLSASLSLPFSISISISHPLSYSLSFSLSLLLLLLSIFFLPTPS